MVDVLCLCLNVVNLRNLVVLGHLCERWQRDLSLYHSRHGGNNLVDVLYLREDGMLGHLIDREALGHRLSADAPRCAPRE